jgi:hypothetical protein
MKVFDDYTRDILEQLNNYKVEYLVVGGYAVNFHGYSRSTGDIDLWIKPDNSDTKAGIIEALRNLQVPEQNLNALESLIFQNPSSLQTVKNHLK